MSCDLLQKYQKCDNTNFDIFDYFISNKLDTISQNPRLIANPKYLNDTSTYYIIAGFEDNTIVEPKIAGKTLNMEYSDNSFNVHEIFDTLHPIIIFTKKLDSATCF